jgi:hypothetical protein
VIIGGRLDSNAGQILVQAANSLKNRKVTRFSHALSYEFIVLRHLQQHPLVAAFTQVQWSMPKTKQPGRSLGRALWATN